MLKSQHILKKDSVNKIINLRISGFSLISLATLFGVHYTAIMWHLRKYAIEEPEEVYDIERIISNIVPLPKEEIWVVVDGERINRGRSYKEYVDYSHRNKIKRIYN